jgi:hypothetical protein
MRLIGAIAASETLETNELNDAFVSLNQMLSSWNTEGASLVGRRFDSVTLTPNNFAYVLSNRPVQIVAAASAIAGVDSSIELVDAAGFEAVQEKALSSLYIKKLFCDYQYPQSSIAIWPSPRAAGNIRLWTLATIAQFQTLADVIDLAPGYEMALRYNLAVALLPEYPRSQPDPSLPAQAQNYKASLVQLNTMNQMRSPGQLPAAAAPVQ